jgi:hypothetical protein
VLFDSLKLNNEGLLYSCSRQRLLDYDYSSIGVYHITLYYSYIILLRLLPPVAVQHVYYAERGEVLVVSSQ